MKKYIFEEYRDKAGTGTQKVFNNRSEAITKALNDWQALNYHDKQSYIDDPAGMFRVYEQEDDNAKDILDLLQIDKMRTKNGYFDRDGKNYILTQQAYLDGIGDDVYFKATAICLQDTIDTDGWQPAYDVTWDATDDDEDLQQDADWDNPAAVECVGEYNLILGRFY